MKSAVHLKLPIFLCLFFTECATFGLKIYVIYVS